MWWSFNWKGFSLPLRTERESNMTTRINLQWFVILGLALHASALSEYIALLWCKQQRSGGLVQCREIGWRGPKRRARGVKQSVRWNHVWKLSHSYCDLMSQSLSPTSDSFLRRWSNFSASARPFAPLYFHCSSLAAPNHQTTTAGWAAVPGGPSGQRERQTVYSGVWGRGRACS